MKKQRIRLSAKKTVLLIIIICAVGALALTASILLAPLSVTASSKPEPPLPPVPSARPVTKPAQPSVPEKGNSGTVDTPQKTPAAPVEKPADKPVEKPPAKQPEKTGGAKSDQTVKPKPDTGVPAVPPSSGIKDAPAVSKGTLVVVFDDAGYNTQQLKKIVNLPFPVTVAVLPGLDYSVPAAKMIRKAGKELFLHQPMQAKNLSVNPGPGAIMPDMSPEGVAAVVLANLAEVGPVSGLNNHEGSLITESAELIGAVLDVCEAERIYFLDSRTTPDTAAPRAAAERGIKISSRDIFLDNSQDRAEIEKMLEAGLKIAEKKGFAVLIGHVWSAELADILLEAWPSLTERGFTFATLSQLQQQEKK